MKISLVGLVALLLSVVPAQSAPAAPSDVPTSAEVVVTVTAFATQQGWLCRVLGLNCS